MNNTNPVFGSRTYQCDPDQSPFASIVHADAVVVPFPKKRAKEVDDRFYSICPEILRSALFSADRGAAGEFIEQTLQTGYSRDRLHFKGKRLTQTHVSVLLALLLKHRGRDTSEPITINARSFSINYLGWADSSTSSKRLRDTLNDLVGAVVSYRWSDKEEEAVSLIGAVKRNDDAIEIRLDRSVVHLLKGHQTWLDVQERKNLVEGLQTWLYGWIRASDCSDWVEIDDLLTLSGKQKSQQEFGRDIRLALQALKDAGAIVDFQASRGRVFITKKGA